MDAKRKVVKWKDTTSASSFTVLGISSHENDYRLAWCLNKELGFDFAQADESFVTKEGYEFSRFEHYDDDDKTLTLISNRCESGILLKKFKNLDYILRFDSELDDAEKAEWLQKLRAVTLISAVYEMPGISIFDF